ncbi:MAG: hypothetical protein CSA97_00665 [Bacteroidetes bacterium]|nr:MAG: hypothetical protein CSA97_00665 [Bacteroidota bacterium]
MPDHVHALIRVPRDCEFTEQVISRSGLARSPMGEAVRQYKVRVKNLARKCGNPMSWQVGFYDRVIPDGDYDVVERYIMDNPRKWWEKYG